MDIDRADERTREDVRQFLQRGGAQRATARRLGVSRETLLAIAYGARVSRGSMALVRERLRALEFARAAVARPGEPPPEAV